MGLHPSQGRNSLAKTVPPQNRKAWRSASSKVGASKAEEVPPSAIQKVPPGGGGGGPQLLPLPLLSHALAWSQVSFQRLWQGKSPSFPKPVGGRGGAALVGTGEGGGAEKETLTQRGEPP